MWWRRRLLSYYHYSSYALKEWCQCKKIHKKSNLKPPHSSNSVQSKTMYNHTTAVVRQRCCCTWPPVLKLCLTSTTQACLALASAAPQSWAAAEADYVSPEVIPLSAAKSQWRHHAVFPLLMMNSWNSGLWWTVESQGPWERKHIPKSLAEHLGEEDSLIPLLTSKSIYLGLVTN